MNDIHKEAEELAKRHYQIEAGIREILQIEEFIDGESVRGKSIKLIEVNENTVPSGVVPIEFDPLPEAGIHFPSVIVEVTPDEFEKIRAGEMKLPKGWQIGDAIPREE